MPKLTIKIIDLGTSYTNPETGRVSPSLTGHIWWELTDDNGNVTSYGFSPKDGYEGMPLAPGSVKYNDNLTYDFNPAKGDYQREFYITKNQLEQLKEFGNNPFDKEKFNFSSKYNGISNSCIDFTYKALEIIGFVPKGYDGDIWPTLNIDNIRALPSSNKNDTKIFIGKEGGLFFLDNQNQITIKLFGNSDTIDNNKINSLAISSAKLGSKKILIKDVNNKKITEFEVRKGDQTEIFNNNPLLKAQVKFLTKNGEEISQDNAIIKFDDTKLNELTLIRTDLITTLKDNTTSTLSSILNAIDSASNHLQSFLVGSVDFGKDLIDSVSSIFDSNNPQLFDRYNNPLYLDQFGNKTTETFHYLLDEDGNQIIDEEGNPIKVQNKKATGPSNLELLLADFASRVATGATIEEASIESAKTAIAREVSKDLVTKIGFGIKHHPKLFPRIKMINNDQSFLIANHQILTSKFLKNKLSFC